MNNLIILRTLLDAAALEIDESELVLAVLCSGTYSTELVRREVNTGLVVQQRSGREASW